ncbi:LGFP repeat-containing protein, partial [Archangium sp.]|uniref:LGFP repeat-containing protein n=1 Tax=Archangium sp. TaxID=1872627 RepID=UPI002D715B39
GVGAFNHFEGGSIYWKNGLGVAAVFGAIRDKWASLGYERSSLGYPVRTSTPWPAAGSRSSSGATSPSTPPPVPSPSG